LIGVIGGDIDGYFITCGNTFESYQLIIGFFECARAGAIIIVPNIGGSSGRRIIANGYVPAIIAFS
jgi:hypothetical protein